MKQPIPLLIFSDAVSAPSGLARITRDLTTRIHASLGDVFKVATIGYGASGSSKFPWMQYSWTHNNDWIIRDLPEIWKDFAVDQHGIFMSIYDPHRMMWLARPETCTDQRVRKFLERAPFAKWGYFPIDATGPGNKLSCMLRECLVGYDRILCYSEWARAIVKNTIGEEDRESRDLDQLPHGIDTKVFFPRPRARQREMFGHMAVGRAVSIQDDEVLVGIVATNQSRKDWGLGIATCAELSKSRKVRIWMHTDVLDRHWSIPYLLADFGLTGANLISLGQLTDETMAKLYSACDVTLGIGLGEGFGYCAAESLACGTPTVTPNYGGGEFVPSEFSVEPVAYRYEGVYNCVRPVMSVKDFSFAADQVTKAKSLMSGSLLPSYVDWDKLWPNWEKWLKRGIE